MPEPSPTESPLRAEVRELKQRIATLEAESRDALAAAQQERDRLAAVLNSITDEVWFADAEGRLAFVNPPGVHEFHLGAIPRDVEKLAAASEVLRADGTARSVDDAPALRALRGELVWGEEEIVRTPETGQLRHREVTASPVKDASGAIIGSVSIVRDVTDRKKAEAALAASEHRFRTLANAIPQLCWIANADGWIFWYNDRWYEYTGTTPQQMEGWGWQSVHDRATLPQVLERWNASIVTGRPFEMVFPLRGADGVFRPFLTRVVPLRDAAGKVSLWFGTNTDISEIREAEERLAASERLYRAIGESIEYGVWVCDPDGRNTYASESFLKLVGLAQEQCSNFGWGDVLHPDDAERTIAAWKECVRSEGCWDIEHRFRGVDGQWHPVLARGLPVRDEQGRIQCWAGINLDISALKRAEAEALRSNAVLEAFFAASPGVLNVLDEEFRVVHTDRLTPTYFGLTPEALIGRSLGELAPVYVQEFGTMMREVIETGQPRLNVEVRTPIPGRGGEIGHWLASYFPLPLPEGKRGIGIMGIEVTELKKAEERLRHAQKLESIGALAAGVAHDFNNLLVAIKGYSDMILSDLDARDPLYDPLLEILKAGDRASALTRQLLAFSGSRVTRPEVLDLNTVIRNLQKMLRRLLTEEIEFRTELGEGVHTARLDPTQIEQAIMNLVVNARDAMPRGGTLTIATANQEITPETESRFSGLKPGPYVCLSVTDTGVGMAADVQQHMFEPFFTTKGPGEGTGLGLSTVYGVVKQHGGDIWVYSEPGRGSTFRLYLPAATAGRAAPLGRPEKPSAWSGVGTILVVEDDATARSLTVAMLRRLGYDVLVSNNGTEALTVAAGYRDRIDLLLTDLVMPHLGGHELARQILAQRPETRVIVMSGYPSRYTADDLDRSGMLFLQKPFALNDLGRVVKEALESPRVP